MSDGTSRVEHWVAGPWRLLRTPWDTYLGTFWHWGPGLEPGPDLDGQPIVSGVVRPTSRTGTIWDGTIVDRIEGSATPGWLEWVPGRQEIAPGDVLWLNFIHRQAGTGPSGYQLFKAGPRGGSTPLWFDLDPQLVNVTGIDVDAAGRLCITDRGAAALHEYLPSGVDGIPYADLTSPVWIDQRGVLDCQYAPDGTLYALYSDPPEVRALDRATLSTTLVRALAGTPRSFALSPAGEVVVVGSDIALAAMGATYTRRGELVELRPAADGNYPLIIDGRRVGDVQLLPDPNTFGDPETRNYANHPAHIVERPDGWLAAVGYVRDSTPDTSRAPPEVHKARLWALDRQDGPLERRNLMLTTQTHPALWGTAIALVPGGEPRDPWTDEVIDPYPDAAVTPEDHFADFTPTPASIPQGSPFATGVQEPSCTGAGSTGATLLALWVVLAAGARRRCSRNLAEAH